MKNQFWRQIIISIYLITTLSITPKNLSAQSLDIESETDLIYVQLLNNYGEYRQLNSSASSSFVFPFDKCTALSPSATYVLQSSMQAEKLAVYTLNPEELVIDSTWLVNWEPCSFQWLTDTIFTIHTNNDEGGDVFNISTGELISSNYQIPPPPDYSSLPNRMPSTRTNFILPSPDSNIILYEQCDGQQTSDSGNICLSSKFVIFNVEQNVVLHELENPDPSLLRGYNAAYQINRGITYSKAAWSSTGKYLTFQHFMETPYDEFNLSVYDVTNSQYLVTDWINASIDQKLALQWSPEGNKLAFWIIGRVGEIQASDDLNTLKSLLIFDADTSEFLVSQTPFDVDPSKVGSVITWSPSGDKLVFVDQDKNLIYFDTYNGISNILDDNVDRVVIWKPSNPL